MRTPLRAQGPDLRNGSCESPAQDTDYCLVMEKTTSNS